MSKWEELQSERSCSTAEVDIVLHCQTLLVLLLRTFQLETLCFLLEIAASVCYRFHELILSFSRSQSGSLDAGLLVVSSRTIIVTIPWATRVVASGEPSFVGSSSV